jgi:hypothetical protein
MVRENRSGHGCRSMVKRKRGTEGKKDGLCKNKKEFMFRRDEHKESVKEQKEIGEKRRRNIRSRSKT